MARNVSIEISARDNFSSAITTMRNANMSFDKDLTGTMTKLDALNKNKVTLKVDVDKARSALKDAEKQFAATGSAADKMALELAGADYDNAKRNLDLVSQNAKEAQKSILNMTDAVSKADNRASKSTFGGAETVLSRLAGAGFVQMVGTSMQGAANTYMTSLLGSEQGNVFSSVLGGVTSGAALGTAALPGVGTAIGAAVGAVAGGINAAAQTYQSQDEAFKSAVQENYDNALQTQETALSSGTSVASTREQNRISFSTMLGGNDKADEFLDKITEFAAKTPFEYDQLTTISRTLLAYGYKQDEIIPLLTKVGDTGSALGMNAEDMNYVATALGRMQSTGKTTLEYLNPLLERGVPVWDYLAKASGKTKEQVQEMVSKGLVPGAQASKAIADYMGKAYEGNMNLQSQTFAGLQSSLEDAQNTMNAAMGKGYNEERKKGLQEQIGWLGGESGTKMSEAYSMIGSWKAYLENAEEKAIRDAMDKAMNEDPEYQKAKASGNQAKMGEILAQAQVDGENNYRKTDGYKLQVETEKSLVSGIRDSMIKDGIYQQYGYDMGLEFSKGIASTAQPGIKAATSPPTMKSDITGTVKGAGGNRGSAPSVNQYPGYRPWMTGSGNATGLNRVPYNNFPALLHEGEVVLTGAEARAAKGSGSGVVITGNTFNVRQESDIDAIASTLFDKIERAAQITP